mgnify:CR=1 FL=1
MNEREALAFDILSRSGFHARVNTLAPPVLLRLATQRLNAVEMACVAPGWLACGRENFAHLFRAAQIYAASITRDLQEPVAMWAGLTALAEAGSHGIDSMKLRGNQWALDCWRSLFCDDSDRVLDETLHRLRYFKIPPLSAHDMLTAMLAGNGTDESNLMMCEILGRAFLR